MTERDVNIMRIKYLLIFCLLYGAVIVGLQFFVFRTFDNDLLKLLMVATSAGAVALFVNRLERRTLRNTKHSI